MNRLSRKLTVEQAEKLSRLICDSSGPAGLALRGHFDRIVALRPVPYPSHYKRLDPVTETYVSPCRPDILPDSEHYYCGVLPPVSNAMTRLCEGALWHRTDTGEVFVWSRETGWVALPKQPSLRLVMASGIHGTAFTGYVRRIAAEDAAPIRVSAEKPLFTFRELKERAAKER